MDSFEEQAAAAQRIGTEIWRLAQSTLLVYLRYLDCALFRLKLQAANVETVQTDGQVLQYSLRWVLKRYAQDRNHVTYTYLHCLLHCVYRHMFVSPTIQTELWDLACDMAVANCIGDFGLSCLQTAENRERTAALEQLKKGIKPFTAEKIYRALCMDPAVHARLAQWRALFRVDDHAPWYRQDDEEDSSGKGTAARAMSSAQAEALWREISHRVQVNLETLSMRGDHAGSMAQELRAVNRERYDYSEFLRRFSVLGEVMQVNDDEFDYIFYTYGLRWCLHELYQDKEPYCDATNMNSRQKR